MQLFQTGPDRYPPQKFSPDAYAAVNQRTLAFFVGLVAICLPLFLIIGAFNPFWRTCFRDSISHYYYAPFWGGPFIGALVFIGTYLFVYKGEDGNRAERRLSTLAGFCAIGVALFPTTGHGCHEPAFTARALVQFDTITGGTLAFVPREGIDGYFMLFPGAATLHYTSAGLLFAFLAWFSLAVFTAVDPHQRKPDGSLTPDKVVRNTIYYVSGVTIIASMLAMAAYAALGAFTDLDLRWWNDHNLTFWFEALSLWAFGLSWMVKGRFLDTLLRDKPVAD